MLGVPPRACSPSPAPAQALGPKSSSLSPEVAPAEFRHRVFSVPPPPSFSLAPAELLPPQVPPFLLVPPSPRDAPACSAPVCSARRYGVTPAGSCSACQPAGAPRLFPPLPPLPSLISAMLPLPPGALSPGSPHPPPKPGVGCGCPGLGKPQNPWASGGSPWSREHQGEGGAGSHGHFQAPSTAVASRQGPHPQSPLPWRRPRGRILPPRGGSRAAAIAPVYESTKLSQQAFSIPFICVSPLSSFYFP